MRPTCKTAFKPEKYSDVVGLFAHSAMVGAVANKNVRALPRSAKDAFSDLDAIFIITGVYVLKTYTSERKMRPVLSRVLSAARCELRLVRAIFLRVVSFSVLKDSWIGLSPSS